MYHFSRSIYRELTPYIRHAEGTEACASARNDVLEACERTINRLISDRRYFARPVKTLFTDVREHFALTEQVHAHIVIERFIEAAVEYMDSLPEGVTLDGKPRQCPASTRKGTPCQRDPRPGREYCPSHRHLEDGYGAISSLQAAA
jgi:hypothetical protein